jgi:ParB family chromosome partitioning protein
MAPEAKPANPKPRLGRGLSSLIISSAPSPSDDQQYQPVPAPPTPEPPIAQTHHPSQPVLDIPTDQIGPNPYQPRKNFDPQDLADLAKSIASQGILQPLIVARADPSAERPYVLVAGERRLRAARLAGLAAVPCTVRAATTQQLLELALIENLQRADLNPVERATAYREYIDRFGLTQADAADHLSQARATVANYLRILDLQEPIREMLLGGSLSFGHAKALAALARPDRQLALARLAASRSLSVRQVEQLVARELAGATDAPSSPAPRPVRMKPAYLRDLEDQLSRTVGTKVTILPGRAKHTGRIVVEYYSLDDFDRIAKSLGVSIES